MPDKANSPVYDKCISCAFASEKGLVYGPWPTSHTDVCCLYKFNRQEQTDSCQLKDVGQKPNNTCDGLCKDCPTRLKFRQLQVELPVQEPSQTSTEVASQEGTADVPPSCTSVHSGTWSKHSKIAPRMRRGFTKLTIEIRPPRFKKKLWFGTWHDDEVDRAKDAINFYMGRNEPFILPDSPLIFAQHPLGIEYRELQPSCEDFIEVGQKKVRTSVYFARRVKEAIKAVTRGKKKAQLAKRPLKSKLVGVSQRIEPVQNESSNRIYKPIMSRSSGCPSSTTNVSCQCGSTSSSVLPCAPGSQSSSADDMVWCGASSEANSELSLVQPSGPPRSEMLPYEGEIPIESELFSLCDWAEETFSLEGNITFSSSPPIAASGEGENESVTMEDNGFPAFLWSRMGTEYNCYEGALRAASSRV